MTERLHIDALRRAEADAAAEHDAVTASVLTALLRAIECRGGKLEFTPRDIQALSVALRALDAVKAIAPADYAARRPERGVEAVASALGVPANV